MPSPIQLFNKLSRVKASALLNPQPAPGNFTGPSTRAKNTPEGESAQRLEDEVNHLIGRCIGWRNEYRAEFSNADRSMANLDSLKQDATRLIDFIWPLLDVPLQRTQAFIELEEFWHKPKDEWREKLRDLKNFRYKLANILIIEQLCHADDLDLRGALQAAVRYRLRVQNTPVVRQHALDLTKFMTHKYEIQPLADKDADDFMANLHAWAEMEQEDRVLPFAQKAELASYLSKYLCDEVPPSAQEALLARGRLQWAGMVYMVKVAIVENLADRIKMNVVVAKAAEKMDEFRTSQSVISEDEVLRAAATVLGKMEVFRENSDFWPSLPGV